MGNLSGILGKVASPVSSSHLSPPPVGRGKVGNGMPGNSRLPFPTQEQETGKGNGKFVCALCQKQVDRVGSTVRLVDGLRRRVGMCCAPAHVKAEQRQTYGSPIDRMAVLVQYLLTGRKLSCVDAGAALECSTARTKAYLGALHDAALVHIERWDRMHTGPWFEVFAWCGGSPKADAPHPLKGKGSHHV